MVVDTADAQPSATFAGVWQPTAPFQPELKTVGGVPPPLLTAAAAIYANRKALYSAGDRSFDNASTVCVSPGMPRMMFLARPFQIVQSATRTAFLFEWNGRRRRVDLGGAPPDPPDLFYMGTAAGKIDGDTLVVDTRGLTDASLLDASGMPHSDQLRLTERYRLADEGATLVDDITIEDRKTFSRPWRTRVSLRRSPPGSEIKEDVCR